jgi:hypothetical protein
MNAIPAIFSAVRLADGRWTLLGPDPDQPCGLLWRSAPFSTQMGLERGRQVVVKVEAGASRRSSRALAS